MLDYVPPLRDLRFILHDVLRVGTLEDLDGFPDLDEGFTGPVLEEAGRIAAEVLRPLNAKGDAEGCVLENGVVRTPEGFREAYDVMREGGWPGFECAPEHGGQGLPSILALMVGQMKSAANMAIMMYHGLTHSAYSALAAHGTESQKALYLPKLASGAWMGTMNLTEPQCGTDLGLVRTRAEPAEDGSYRITGTKIWISAGEHDLADNIVHLVLARLPDAPEGTRGLSLFVVPKFLPDADGNPGARNAVQCVGIEDKMGIHASATCTMAYDGATGWLVAEPHKGLRAMFTMMNEARLLVGMQGIGVADAAWQAARAFALDRLQGRSVTGAKNPEGPADPIHVHPDVRRMLMECKAFAEGGRMLLAWVCLLLDTERRHRDPAERERAAGMVALLTPVAKAFLTEEGFRIATLAQQVAGGAGYIEDSGLSQLVRDARITMVYEGTTGVQALDLVGRKLAMAGGRPVRALMAEVAETAAAVPEALRADIGDPLAAAGEDLKAAVGFLAARGMKDPETALAGSVDFLHLLGRVAMGLCWTRMALASQAALDAGAEDAVWHEAKIATAAFHARRMLPETGMRLARVKAEAGGWMGLPAEAL